MWSAPRRGARACGHAPPRASSPAWTPSRTPPTRRTHAIRARPSGRARPRRPRRPTLPAPCRGRPARPRGTARSIPDLQAFLLRRAVLLLHLREQRLGLVHFLPVGLRLRLGLLPLDSRDLLPTQRRRPVPGRDADLPRLRLGEFAFDGLAGRGLPVRCLAVHLLEQHLDLRVVAPRGDRAFLARRRRR